MYTYAILDPRPQGAAHNDSIFAAGPVYGVEVTVPALAARCAANIDPQHSRMDDGEVLEHTAILACALPGTTMPPAGSVLATVRPDLDSIGGMAVLALRLAGRLPPSYPVGGVWRRIARVAEADSHSVGPWSPGPLPSPDAPWAASGAVSEVLDLAPMAAAVADHTVPIERRVEWMVCWLETGEEPPGYRARVESERADMVAALSDGRISVREDRGIAIVESSHRGALGLGYCLAPVVVAVDAAFRFGGGVPHRKYTICAYDASHADIRAATAELSTLEPGWGGSQTIGGSPQGVSSTLTLERVVDVVRRHLSVPGRTT